MPPESWWCIPIDIFLQHFCVQQSCWAWAEIAHTAGVSTLTSSKSSSSLAVRRCIGLAVVPTTCLDLGLRIKEGRRKGNNKGQNSPGLEPTGMRDWQFASERHAANNQKGCLNCNPINCDQPSSSDKRMLNNMVVETVFSITSHKFHPGPGILEQKIQPAARYRNGRNVFPLEVL